MKDGEDAGRYRFRHGFIDDDGNYDAWGSALLVDLNGDGHLDYVTGGRGGGFLFWYEYGGGRWTKHVMADDFSPSVGATSVDLDGDGRVEIVCGEWEPEGRLWWIVPPGDPRERWRKHVVAQGHHAPHDILSGDVDNDGRPEVIVRVKDEGIWCYFAPPDPARRWRRVLVARKVPGDGTALYDLDGDGNLDIVTAGAWFRNVNGDGTRWEEHPFLPATLGWDRETRLAVAHVLEGPRPQLVMTESEKTRGARLAIAHVPEDPRRSPWEVEVIVPEERDLRALHSLAVADFDGDGRLEIFTAEMENAKTDGIGKKPRWFILKPAAGRWEEHVILDRNLGTHEARVGDVTGNGLPDIVGKTWRPNKVNGNRGRQHVDWLENLGAPGA